MDYRALFHLMHPDFFEKEYVRNIGDRAVFEEQILPLAGFDVHAVQLSVPEEISFGYYSGEPSVLLKAVAEVDEGWVECYQDVSHAFCAFHGGKPVSFCLVDPMGEYCVEGRHIRVGGPGCVGTVPAYRKQGIGLKMVQLATQILKEKGFDYSYIHYTGVGHWYARLGYETIVKWNGKGFVEA